MRGAAELRVKESDRIAALVAGFRALGIDADERPDGFVVARPARRAAGRRRRRRARRSPDGDGVRDRRAGAPSGPSHDRRRRRRSPSPIPASSRRSGRLVGVKADKIYLVGFMAAGKTTRRARAGAAARLAAPWTSTS